MKLTLDFETRSRCDIRATNEWVYAEHPSTEVLCLAVKVDDEPPRLWVPDRWLGLLAPANLPYVSALAVHDLVAQADIIEAHNASFEWAIWTHVMSARHGWPELPEAKRRCSAARAAMCALPRALGEACAAIGLPVQKDMAGRALMMKMCRPRKPTKANPAEWVEDPESLVGLFRYCLQDVEAEHALSEALPDLPPSELEIWRLDQTINRRGLYVDRVSAERLIDVTNQYTTELLAEFVRLTGGAVRSPRQVNALRDFLQREGLSLEDLTKATVGETLRDSAITPLARRLLEIRASLGKSSVAKFDALVSRTQADGRMRGYLLYHGASTGRWSGKAFQPQNLPREGVKDFEVLLGALATNGDPLGIVRDWWGDPMVIASRLIRNVVMAAPGKVLYCGDYSSIESRATNWVAGEQWALDAYRAGTDMYKLNASQIFGCAYDDVTKGDPRRQVGKVAELALGYNGGIAAFATMARGYDIDLETLPTIVLPTATDSEKAKAGVQAKRYRKTSPGTMSLEAAMACDIIKQRWRVAHPSVTRFWKAIQEAAVGAVQDPGSIVEYRGLRLCKSGSFLLLRLPSGRNLYYYDPRVRVELVEGENEDGTLYTFETNVLSFMDVDSTTKQWTRQKTYGGKLTENLVQGLCRDLCAAGMLAAERAGYPVVLSVHDEVVSETAENFGSVEEFEKLICTLPPWADGLPIGAEGWKGKRYRK